jgi:hypothetical protein
VKLLSNVWNQPRTSAAGLLIAIVTIAATLSQQGITLGKAGTGTIVTLIAALATALLGLLAKDPATPPASANATAKLGALALITLLLPLPFATGCSAATVAQDIVNWTPALQSAVATVDSTAALLAPADAPIFTAATLGFDAASNLLAGQAKAYLANPSITTLAKIQHQVVTFQQQVNAALLEAAKIVDPASQKHSLAAVKSVATIVTTLLSLVQSVSSKAAVAQMAAQSIIKLATVAPYLDLPQAARLLATHYAEPTVAAQTQTRQMERQLTQAGF